MSHQILTVQTPGRGLHDITPQIATLVAEHSAGDGLVHLFLQHTSASLLIQENADPAVLRDLETWFAGAVKDGDPRFVHTDEGDDDMSAHVRTALTSVSLTIPCRDGRLMLGTWQGIYLWEHRYGAKQRRIVVTL